MKNSPDETITTSAVDHREALARELDAGILSRSRRRATIDATIEALQSELLALNDADEVAYASIKALEERRAGLRPKEA